jgi:hypothetical protein
MKTSLMLAAALAAAPLAAKTPMQPIPGVADKETIIPYAEISRTVRGHGDVAYVNARGNQWYRVQLNPGCLKGITQLNSLIFRHHGAGGQIDRFTTVIIGGGARTCNIKSIRQSKPPPSIDPKSPVTMQ